MSIANCICCIRLWNSNPGHIQLKEIPTVQLDTNQMGKSEKLIGQPHACIQGFYTDNAVAVATGMVQYYIGICWLSPKMSSNEYCGNTM